MKTWKWTIVCLVLGLLLGCSSKDTPPPAPTLAPTLAALPTATATPTLPPPTPTPLPTPTEVPLAARVNGRPILLTDFEREVARAGDSATPRQVLDAMIEMLLLEQAAAEAGVTVTDEQLDEIVQADIEAVGGQEVFQARIASNNMTEEEYREQVRSNLIAQRVQMQLSAEVPATLEHVHARHILVATLEEAEAILTQLSDGADFDTLARTYSKDVSTRDRGGDLGFFPRGLLLAPELEEVAFALAPGQISKVIHSELLGYHIVQVLEREERPVDEEETELIQAAQIRRWRESLWAEATVERLIEP
ncbi:MAG: peptidylprolyl isomerase [Anaerolineae bacterium]|nr:MAG: peptidylprolyl isomerase [Anaerolineae bacterium]